MLPQHLFQHAEVCFFYCNMFVFLFDVKILNIFEYVESGAGCMCVYVDGALVFSRAGRD